MQKWQYGLAVYVHRANQKSTIDVENSDLPMSDVTEPATGYLTRFLKAAGERGWELTTTISPFAEGQNLTQEVEGGKDDLEFVVQDRHEIQWLIFKRPGR
jgi:hypothetical protein